ncbi:MAG: site-2 protease family protein [Thermoguttaceae bacterium]
MFYKLDSTRVSLREYWWGTPKPLILVAWLLKLLRVRLPGSTDDPNVASLEPFRVEPAGLPPEVRQQFHQAHQELQTLGFHSPVCYWIHDARNQADICQAVYLHDSGQALARVHHRVWQFPKPAKVYFFPVFLTSFTDGTWLASTAGRRDMLAPAACRENRRVGATAADLWASHQAELQKELLFKTVRPVRNDNELLAAVEAHHATVRDFHVGRGVFAPLTDQEQQAAMEAAQAAPAENTETTGDTSVLIEEIEKLQNRRTGWAAALLVLLVSVGLFLGLGAAQWSWEFAALLLPILFVHELGHYAAMRLFRYSNVKMFFIPMLGAAVSGRHYNVPGWKKVIVSLAGPLPGIFVGTALGLAAAWLQIPWLLPPAMLAIGLNAFNLLPILPLDGGWVMHALFFSRNYVLDAGFRVLAVAILLLGSYWSGDRFLFFFGLLMAAGLPVSFRMARVVSRLRYQAISTASPDDQSIPPATAQAIAEEIRRSFRQRLTNKNLAQLTLQAFEALNARPPGVAATIGLGGLYAGSLVFALAALAFLAVGMPFFHRHDDRAQYPVSPAEIQVAGADRTAEPKGGEATIVARFADAPKALARFDEVGNELPADAALVRFGSSLLLAIPAEADLPERWKARLAPQTKEIFVCPPELLTGFSLSLAAPSEEKARQIESELANYQACSAWIFPSPPWHPAGGPTPDQLQARRLYVKVIDTDTVYDDPRYLRLSEQAYQASEKEDDRRTAELWQQLEDLRRSLREEQLDEFSEKAADEHQRRLVELCRRRPEPEQAPEKASDPAHPRADEDARAREKAAEEYRRKFTAWENELAEVLGGTPRGAFNSSTRSDRFAFEGGAIYREGQTVHLEYAELSHPVDAAPALVRWLAAQGGTDIKYSFFASE